MMSRPGLVNEAARSEAGRVPEAESEEATGAESGRASETREYVKWRRSEMNQRERESNG
ncbi:hypothetical protein AXF42_Ash000381 [Apostasia shenzhenica]|uniref:Uncharacterized protein n=1 Tax=Apostasia shenzhenica TaxID=1088818 RepID=A0A2I0AGC4_9ASPA|nr:hypothetical protein AXF42_Ash000381 [Apostasia shenzhenica]